ncbi:MAG: endonuclease/exonuclease/phosphatase family protein [Polyangiaceae bacterium]
MVKRGFFVMHKLVTFLVLLAVVSGCTPPPPSVPAPLPPPPPLPSSVVEPPPPPPAPGPTPESAAATIRIATFNIRQFGVTKRNKPEVMAILVEIVRRYDVVAIQEIKDASGETPGAFLNAINALDGPDYAVVASPRTGATASSSAKEQYAYYVNTATVEVLDDGALFPDPSDAFVREPWAARFRATRGNFSFVLLDIHTQPTAAVAEVGALHDAVLWARTRYDDEDDFIALGDYNASCSYASPAQLDDLAFRGASYTWIVPDDADTNLAASACAYDRIVSTDAANGDYTGRWGVDRAFSDTAVSDHWPVWAEFYADRDGRSCCKTCTAGKACGDTCIAASATCTAAPGCVCDE